MQLSNAIRDSKSYYVRPLSPFGAEMIGFDITAITSEDAKRIRQALADQGVLVIRHQEVSDADFVNFLKALGPLTFTTGETPLADQPCLNIVSNVGRTRPPRSVFHTDTSYVAQPPAYTALKAIALPQSGGETLFSNQYQAFETLPNQVKTQLSKAQVHHVVSGLDLTGEQETECWHPLFRQHPISGRTALFLSTPERCQAISGLEATLGHRAIRVLYKHSIRPHRLYRHRWQSGDIVIWDNRCTMHRADHSQVLGDRVLHRGLVSGEVPLNP
ncbi:TauD/TfdA family dioxygenase [Oscillatoria sp. CS-180]|uniref:TauD/TfdA dioxygenase family protein n=1 Tax=Oscillatoria sp. CS-180 TaxID=3021720 RepID=UPI00232B3157|nr:TauD/TfdA family dioxygenase [Oscillatoria sp. CS-180]MDB9528355.1 TauD/TfdA family dioxygenase [Oscillatoria sp. CS-180]